MTATAVNEREDEPPKNLIKLYMLEFIPVYNNL